VALGVA